MALIQYKPIALFDLDDDTPFADSSGYAHVATATGSEIRSLPLAPGLDYAQSFYSTGRVGTFTVPEVFARGKESSPFSIASSLYVEPGSALQRVASHSDCFDGLLVQGNVLMFSTSYNSAGDARCSYRIEVSQKIDVVGVHTKSQNLLFVNGELVDSVDITPAQQIDVYKTNVSTFTSGDVASGGGIVMNSLAFFNRGLSPEEIESIHASNLEVTPQDVARSYGGREISLGTATRTPWRRVEWGTGSEWTLGTHFNTVTDGDELRPQMTDGLTLSADWYRTVNLIDPVADTTLNSANIYWLGTNVSVQASVDNTNWVNVVNGTNLSNITAGMSSATAIVIRAHFDAGFDDAHLDYIKLDVYTSATGLSGGRNIIFTNAVNYDDHPVNELRDDWGVNLTNGSISIAADAAPEPLNPRTVELWVKCKDPSGINWTSDTSTLSALYTNAILVGGVLAGQWVVYHMVFNAPYTSTINISANATLGKMVLYPTALTQAQILEIIKANTGKVTSTLDPGDVISLTESAIPAVVYGRDWHIIAS